MNKKRKIKYQTNKGAAMMILVFFFVFISFTLLVSITMPVIREFKIAASNFNSKQSYYLAESGVEDILFRIKNNRQYDTNEVLSLGFSSVITTITDISSSKKEIISSGDSNSFQRKISSIVDTGVGASFNYGVLTGLGGFSMDNGSKIVGSVYSNGPISGPGTITGSATSANPSALTSDQSNGSGVPTYDITFGKSSSSQDFAQSFQVSTSHKINKVNLYLKKVGTPSNLSIYITNDHHNKPGHTKIAIGSISSSLVSPNYGWVEVPLSTTSQLNIGTTYWLVIDAHKSSSKYYKIAANNNGYTNGVSKIGKYDDYWNNNSPSSLDAFFNIYIGGGVGSINGVTIGTGSAGNAYANTINNTTIEGIIYCQTGTGNNKECDTSQVDPVQLPMPISNQNILDWKDSALIGGTYNGDYSVSNSEMMGPKKINGDLNIKGNKTLTLSGPIWVTGKLTVENGATIKLGISYSNSSEVIIVDGKIKLENNSNFIGSGTTGSYILALTTSSSHEAIEVENNSGAAALYAANGTIKMSNNATATSIVGYSIHLNNNAVITYDSGMTNINFIGGPSGSWNINSWKEIK